MRGDELPDEIDEFGFSVDALHGGSITILVAARRDPDPPFSNASHHARRGRSAPVDGELAIDGEWRFA